MSSSSGLLHPSDAVDLSPIATQHSPQTAYDPPYDSPDTYHDAGDISTYNTNSPQSAHPLSPQYKNSTDYSYHPAGSTFDTDTKSLMSVAKRYDHRESRMYLLRAGLYRFSITLGISIMIGISLKAYEGFREPFIMSKSQVRVFNALMLGLSLALGLNLASSLKRYAEIFRWYLLTRRYVSLEVFDLILGLGALAKVAKLMIISLPGIGPQGRLKFLRKLPWFREGRGDGTHFTWIVCALWIIVNVAAQVLVATLSLFWPVDPANGMALMTHGNVTVANMTTWTTEVPRKGWWKNQTAMDAAWAKGIEAGIYPVLEMGKKLEDPLAITGTPLFKGDDFYQYNFYNRDPDRQASNYVESSRFVQARASCKQLTTTGRLTVTNESIWVVAKEEGQSEYHKVFLPISRTGSISWSSSVYSNCGPRCTNLTVYQEAEEPDIPNNSLFYCESRLSEITGDTPEFINLSDQDREALYGNEEFARLAAGAIGWTGASRDGWDDRQTQTYMRGTTWSPSEAANKAMIEDLLKRFTIGAIAAHDDHGVRYNLTNQPSRPVQGSTLDVNWDWVFGLLGATCALQFAALIFLLAFGNKTIIRDDSYFSLAMLLSSVVNKVGTKESLNLSGSEIKNHPKLLFKRIKYDYTEGKNGEPNKVEVVFLGRGDWESRRSWTPGMYT